MIRSVFTGLMLSFVLAACSGWTVQPLPYIPPTPFPTITPSIHTATPIILPPPVTSTIIAGSLTPIPPSETVTPSSEPTFTETSLNPTFPPTIETVPSIEITVDILGCNTSLDITHGMGEVTNAYVTLANLGSADLENVCATLRGQDEGRPHPDKTKCVSLLPVGSKVTQKLTIDTTYKKDSPIQVDVTSNDVLILRVGKDSCTDLGLLPPDPNNLGVLHPIP